MALIAATKRCRPNARRFLRDDVHRRLLKRERAFRLNLGPATQPVHDARESPTAASPAATLVGLGAIALWSVLALLTASAGAIPPFELAALTFAIGGGFGLLYAAARGRLAALIQPWPVWLVGVGGLFGYHALYFAALEPRAAGRGEPDRLPLAAADRAVLGAVAGRAATAAPRVGALLGFVGAALFACKGGLRARSIRACVGYALALACAFIWSSYSVLSRRLKGAPTEAVAGFCLVTAGSPRLSPAFEPTSGRRTGGMARHPRAWPRPGGPAFYVWDFGVKHGDIRLLGVAAYAAPVLSTLILVVAGFAPPTPSLGLACALIVGGAVLATRRRITTEKRKAGATPAYAEFVREGTLRPPRPPSSA